MRIFVEISGGDVHEALVMWLASKGKRLTDSRAKVSDAVKPMNLFVEDMVPVQPAQPEVLTQKGAPSAPGDATAERWDRI